MSYQLAPGVIRLFELIPVIWLNFTGLAIEMARWENNSGSAPQRCGWRVGCFYHHSRESTEGTKVLTMDKAAITHMM
mgnify:CR=1 FL=1